MTHLASRILLIAALVAVAGAAGAAEARHKTKLEKISERARAAAKVDADDAKIVSVHRIGEEPERETYEVVFEKDGAKRTVVFDQEGQKKSEEVPIATEALPEAVRTAATKDEAVIDKAIKRTMGERVVYRLVVKAAKGKKRELVFNAEGKDITPE